MQISNHHSTFATTFQPTAKFVVLGYSLLITAILPKACIYPMYVLELVAQFILLHAFSHE